MIAALLTLATAAPGPIPAIRQVPLACTNEGPRSEIAQHERIRAITKVSLPEAAYRILWRQQGGHLATGYWSVVATSIDGQRWFVDASGYSEIWVTDATPDVRNPIRFALVAAKAKMLTELVARACDPRVVIASEPRDPKSPPPFGMMVHQLIVERAGRFRSLSWSGHGVGSGSGLVDLLVP